MHDSGAIMILVSVHSEWWLLYGAMWFSTETMITKKGSVVAMWARVFLDNVTRGSWEAHNLYQDDQNIKLVITASVFYHPKIWLIFCFEVYHPEIMFLEGIKHLSFSAFLFFQDFNDWFEIDFPFFPLENLRLISRISFLLWFPK